LGRTGPQKKSVKSIDGKNMLPQKRNRPESALLVYNKARGDDNLQDSLFRPESIREGLDLLARYPYGHLAKTPEMVHRFEEVLERRYNSTDGPYIFETPNYATLENRELAAFYGVQPSSVPSDTIRTGMETIPESRHRLLAETARELAPELVALAQTSFWFERESWARFGPYRDQTYTHADPDKTLFRNLGGLENTTMDIGISTSEKRDIIDGYQAVPDYTFAVPHEGWQVDARSGYWSDLPVSANTKANGFQ
jgi:hypothetical protein